MSPTPYTMSVEIIRDPLWNNIRLDPLSFELIDTPAFQRLRFVRQLGLAFLVYPGATHSRFEHALGTYHLARRTLTLFEEQDDFSAIGRDECMLVRIAALLHDIGHYPFSHALEEIGALHHEEVARPLICDGEVAEILRRELGANAPDQIITLIRGDSTSPLQGLISGSIDLDKLDYLRRDAFMCGVSYGEIDVDRLINALTLLRDPETDLPQVGMIEKGLSALESLLFAKYQMYRNVYWHHAVRSATAMYKRLVADALDAGALDARALAAYTDEGLLHNLDQRAPSPLLRALRERRLYKRAFEAPAAQLAPDVGEWIADDRTLTIAVENALAAELGLEPGELLLDYPVKTQMLGLDLLVQRPYGEVRRLTAAGWEGAINLPKLSEEFYRSARWLRVYTRERRAIPRESVLALVSRTAEDIRSSVTAGATLL
ncbi:MAG TPA: HD domain-containing protein [Gemmatimonadaceae bacterium]|nr:HD domain-containing protein [Gemmatimonadaceae bacterium]